MATVWEAVVLLLWRQWSIEQYAPTWQLYPSHQSVSRAVGSYWQIRFPAPHLPLLLPLFYPSPSAFQWIPPCLWLPVCLCVTTDISSASSLHSPSSAQSLFSCSRCLSLSTRLCLTFSFPFTPHPPPPSICCMFTCHQSTALVWLWVSLHMPPSAAADLIYTPTKQAQGRAWSLMTRTRKLATHP